MTVQLDILIFFSKDLLKLVNMKVLVAKFSAHNVLQSIAFRGIEDYKNLFSNLYE